MIYLWFVPVSDLQLDLRFKLNSLAKELRKEASSFGYKHAPSNFYGISYFFITYFLYFFCIWLLVYSIKSNASNGILILISVALSFAIVRFQFLLHECSHAVLVNNRKLNDFIGELAGYTVAYPFKIYRRNHAKHHALTGTIKDPEIDNFIVDQNLKSLRIQFLFKTVKSLFFVDAIQLIISLFAKQDKEINQKQNCKNYSPWLLLVSILIQSCVVISFFGEFNLHYIMTFIVFYLISMMSFAFVLNRFRGMSEHSISTNLDKYDFTLTHKKRLLTFLIAPLNFNYHYEHHVWPEVSSFWYPKLNQFVISKGYSKYQRNGYLETLRYIWTK